MSPLGARRLEHTLAGRETAIELLDRHEARACCGELDRERNALQALDERQDVSRVDPLGAARVAHPLKKQLDGRSRDEGRQVEDDLAGHAESLARGHDHRERRSLLAPAFDGRCREGELLEIIEDEEGSARVAKDLAHAGDGVPVERPVALEPSAQHRQHGEAETGLRRGLGQIAEPRSATRGKALTQPFEAGERQPRLANPWRAKHGDDSLASFGLPRQLGELRFPSDQGTQRPRRDVGRRTRLRDQPKRFSNGRVGQL